MKLVTFLSDLQRATLSARSRLGDKNIAAHGPIPDDHDIHHRNEDRADNVLTNLQLLSKSDHTKLHGFRGNQHTKCRAS